MSCVHDLKSSHICMYMCILNVLNVLPPVMQLVTFIACKQVCAVLELLAYS